MKKYRRKMNFKNNYIRRILLLGLIAVIAFTNSSQLTAQTEIHLDDRDNYAKQTIKYVKDGNWAQGKKTIDEGLKKYPNDSDLRMLLGKYYFERKEYDKARFELLKSLEFNKHNVEAKQILLNVEIETKQYSSAICYINELLEVNPYWKGLWNKKIEVYRLQGNHVEANRLLKRISQIYPNDNTIKSEYLYYVEQEAAAKKKEGKINTAIDLITTLIEEDPLNEEYYLELINSYLEAGDYKKALINTERGLYNLPASQNLIDKKADILGGQHRYDEALAFLRLKMKDGRYNAHLQQKYNYIMESAVQHYRLLDTYTLYKIMFERNPRNEEAFNYVVNTATANGLYEEALEAIKIAKKVRGETKPLLVKEQTVYERMGAQAKINQVRVRLYQLFPEDSDIRDQYTAYRFQQAKSDMNDGLFEKAINHWRFVNEYGDEEQKKVALVSIYNCAFELDKFAEALTVLDRLKQAYPDELEWGAKKAVVFGEQKRYIESLAEYERVVRLTDPIEMERAINGYEELATIYTKQLIEEYLFQDALRLIEHWLEVNPKSEMGIRYAINVSAQMKDSQRMMKYTLLGFEHHPENTFFKIKLAEAYNYTKDHKQALDILSPEIAKNPYHKELVGAYSQSSEDYAQQLIKDSKPQEALSLLDTALVYDPTNKSLKYWKGIAHEKTNEYDSAYHYQQFYEPAPLELKDFSRHLKYLKNKTYKNQLGLHYLRGRLGDVDIISTIATLEYIRFEQKNTYAGRVNYAGRQQGKGVQIQGEWGHMWRDDILTRADIAWANNIFSSFTVNASVFKSFKNDWEVELGAGFRNMVDKKNMLNVVGGVSKELDKWWFNARLNSITFDNLWYYSLSVQARFYLTSPKTYLTAKGSFGSAPDVDVINNQLYDAFSVTNSMVGVGIRHLLSDMFSVGILGTWYNYEDHIYKFEEGSGKYRNLYNLYIHLNVSF